MGAANSYPASILGHTPSTFLLHLTAIVTGGLLCPATLSTTGTASPVAIPAGTATFTWYNPASPGVRPLNDGAGAATPPMVTVTGFTVHASGENGAGDPSVTAGVTAPNPVQ